MAAELTSVDTPFFISPSPTSLYLTPSLQATLAKVRFALNKRQGLSTVLGDVGLGKSSILRYLYAEYAAHETVTSTLIPTPTFPSEFAMLKSICLDFGLAPRRSLTAQLEELNSFLVEQYEAGRLVVLFIDEAQKLSNTQLEFVRDFLNFETNESKLIQIVLAGQLELRDRLLTPALKAIYSRLIGPCLLAPLTAPEIGEMIQHRCQLYRLENPFTQAAVERLFLFSAGVPRAALRLCAFSYEWARLSKSPKVEPEHVESAFQDLKIEEEKENGGEG